LNFLHRAIKNRSPLQRWRQVKKPALIAQVRAVKSKETLKYLKN